MSDLNADYERVREALAEVYRDEGIVIWMAAPNPLLKGEVPTDLIARGEADKVLAVIAGLAEGVVF